jgi:hypothetical protein
MGPGRPSRPPRLFGVTLARLTLAGVAAVLLAASPASAASMCVTDGATPGRLGDATAKASASFLEAASKAFLAFRALERGDDVRPLITEASALLHTAMHGYEDALKLTDDVEAADRFLRDRPFDRLRRSLGITPGTLAHTRWDVMEKIARESKKPTADLLLVCIAGAGQLRVMLGNLRPDMNRIMLRKTAAAWYAVLAHGALVSDAFDTSVQ